MSREQPQKAGGSHWKRKDECPALSLVSILGCLLKGGCVNPSFGGNASHISSHLLLPVAVRTAVFGISHPHSVVTVYLKGRGRW